MRNNQQTARRFRPLGNYVLVQREQLPELTQTGLFMLGRDFPTVGRVLAIGPGSWRKYKIHVNHLRGEGTCNKGWLGCFHTYAREPLDLEVGDLVQWSVGSNFDLASVAGLPPNCLLLHYDELNFRGRD